MKRTLLSVVIVMLFVGVVFPDENNNRFEISQSMYGQLSTAGNPFMSTFLGFTHNNISINLGVAYWGEHEEESWLASIIEADYVFGMKSGPYLGVGIIDKFSTSTVYPRTSSPFIAAGYKHVLFNFLYLNIAYNSYLEFIDKKESFYTVNVDGPVTYGSVLRIGLGISIGK